MKYGLFPLSTNITAFMGNAFMKCFTKQSVMFKKINLTDLNRCMWNSNKTNS